MQFACAMGYRVVAIDSANKLDICSNLGAEFCIDTKANDLADRVVAMTGGGCHGVVCLAGQLEAFETSIALARKKGVIVCVALPSGSFATPIFDITMKCLSIKGSLVGTRADMQEAFDFVARGKVHCHTKTTSFTGISTLNFVYYI